MNRLLSYLTPKAPWTFVYMLQQYEYSSGKLLRWSMGLPNLFLAQKRGSLDRTARAILLLLVAYWGWATGVVGMGLALLQTGRPEHIVRYLLAPLLAFILLVIANFLLEKLIVKPKEKLEINGAQKRLRNIKSVKIAVLGSYGKTTMKELLQTVLSQGRQVAATPGNKNVLISHARWVNSLSGDEDVLIFEFGEYVPGDIELLAKFSRPDRAVITGISSAHLDNYKSVETIAADFSNIFSFAEASRVLTNHDSPELVRFLKRGVGYSQKGCGDWQAKNVSVNLTGTHFVAQKKSRKIEAHSGLVGEHMVGPLLACIAIADELGLSDAQIAEGILQTKPFEHRMQPYQLGSAWVIDDTYNGNLEGMRAGLQLLSGLEARRKVYVTPGLVEQGDQVEAVHIALGEAIASARPDKVVLMQNSTTEHIKQGLNKSGFQGELQIHENPLEFYTNLEHFVAAGDIVMLQNDWPDNYA